MSVGNSSSTNSVVPLMLMYPQADVPVVQLSVQSHKGAGHHIALGRSIARLRDDNVLVMGSGGFVHNLRRIAPPGAPEPDWSREFSDWMHAKLMAGDEAALAGPVRDLECREFRRHPAEWVFVLVACDPR